MNYNDFDLETNFKQILYSRFLDEDELDNYLSDIEDELNKDQIEYIILDENNNRFFVEFNYISRSQYVNIKIYFDDNYSIDFIKSPDFKTKLTETVDKIIDDINTRFKSYHIASVPNAYIRYLDKTFFVECDGQTNMTINYDRLKVLGLENLNAIDDIIEDIIN